MNTTYLKQEPSRKFIEHTRQIISPYRIRSISDAKIYPNDLLLSYLISDLKLTREDLVLLLQNPKRLQERLDIAEFSVDPELQLLIEKKILILII